MTAELTERPTTTITFDHTIPQAMVDRGDPTTVLVTSWVRDGLHLTAGAHGDMAIGGPPAGPIP